MEKIYKLPLEDVNENTALITNLFFSNGDFVSKDEIIYSFETTKAAIDVAAENSGYIYYSVEEGRNYEVGEEICLITDSKNLDINVFLESRKSKEINKKDNENYTLTRKAQALANKLKIDLNNIDLQGIIREKDIYKFLNSSTKNNFNTRGSIIYLDVKNEFIRDLLSDNSFKKLTSEEKIKLYRQNGHIIGNNVKFESGALIISNKIHIENNVTIGENTIIESPIVNIGKNSKIGKNCQFVASIINIGSDNIISDKVNVDISGGRNFDSELIMARGCLISSDVYINVCHQVKLGDQVALSPRSMLFTHSYWQSVLDGYTSNFGSIEMKDNSWLGAAAQILPNVIIGEGSIIMSNSVVNTNVKNYSLVGGVPAIQIRENIKRVLSLEQKINELKNIFKELIRYLAESGFTVEQLSDNSVRIKKDKTNQTIYFVFGDELYQAGHDITICLNRNNEIKKKSKCLFCIEEKSYKGSLSIVESQLLTFFRRKGLRFYESF